uniref:Synaptobrevin, longin-like domain protein n=1 Tax=Tanacetum cinerariifolium TaxID=118510 RepID=A0A699JTP5_TANCI|nr:hypothetical protein [Tanacetum cinerariifolium]
MARLAFYDYHNMIAILEKYEHNIDFYQIVDFVKASHLRYALTINPTVYVSHIQQFWSTARIETMDEGTKILASVYGKLRTISESSIRRNLKLRDKAGISSLSDAKLFENLTLLGYNILPNQKFSFQKGQFSDQWKFLIHTIMQCLSPKSTGFNEFSNNIATAMGEGSAIPTEAHHTPSPQEQHLSHHYTSSPLHPTSLRQYSRRATRIAQSKALSPTADEGSMEIGEEVRVERSTKLGSNDTYDMVNVLSATEAANILTSEVAVVSVSPVLAATTVGISE